MMEENLILGGGISGLSAAKLLLHQGKEVSFYDDYLTEKTFAEKWAKQFSTPAPLLRKKEELESLIFSQVVLSPGISLFHPVCLLARERGIPIVGEAELGLRMCHQRVIGVTGTKGKSTVVSMIAHVLNKAGIPARALGNIGVPLASYFCAPNLDEVIVLELSSFQLETTRSKKLDVAVLLNITPDHIDQHGSFENYVAAKLSIRNLLRDENCFFVGIQQIQERKELIQGVPREGIWSLPMMRENFLASFLAVESFGISFADFVQFSLDFQPLRHRLEFVAKIGERSVYNDSKATTPEATLASVRSVEAPVTLLAGGLDKGLSFLVWREGLLGKVDRILAFGSAREKIREEVGEGIETLCVETLQEALDLASFAGKGSVLLAPGCASWDQFENYAQRGDLFVHLIEELRS